MARGRGFLSRPVLGVATRRSAYIALRATTKRASSWGCKLPLQHGTATTRGKMNIMRTAGSSRTNSNGRLPVQEDDVSPVRIAIEEAAALLDIPVCELLADRPTGLDESPQCCECEHWAECNNSACQEAQLRKKYYG